MPESDEDVESGAGDIPCRADRGLEGVAVRRAVDDVCSGSDGLPHVPQGSWPPHAGHAPHYITPAASTAMFTRYSIQSNMHDRMSVLYDKLKITHTSTGCFLA